MLLALVGTAAIGAILEVSVLRSLYRRDHLSQVLATFALILIAAGFGVAVMLFLLVTHTRAGMRVRAGASNREMAEVMGVDVKRLFTVVFAIAAALCAVAGALLGPLLAVQVGMGESILILAFVVVVIGGIGSIRGAFAGALLVGLVDTAGRALLVPALASIAIYVLMAAVLFFRPQGLFPARG
jgi:branched-chain amino acid transport system permease protein